MSVQEHKAHAPARDVLRVGLITASDSRTPKSDEGGALMRALAEQAGFQTVTALVLREEPGVLRDHISRLLQSGQCDAILITGGTGVSGRDSTVEAITPLLEKSLPGFGELFRMLSFAEIGAAAMLSRAMAGTAGQTALFAMPGSPAGVRLAMERLIVPELAHLVGQLRRHREAPGHGHGHQHG